MPVIGATFSRGCSDGARGFADLELFFGLAQRNRGRKTTYFDAVRGGKTPGLCRFRLGQRRIARRGAFQTGGEIAIRGGLGISPGVPPPPRSSPPCAPRAPSGQG